MSQDTNKQVIPDLRSKLEIIGLDVATAAKISGISRKTFYDIFKGKAVKPATATSILNAVESYDGRDSLQKVTQFPGTTRQVTFEEMLRDAVEHASALHTLMGELWDVALDDSAKAKAQNWARLATLIRETNGRMQDIMGQAK